MYGSPTLDGSGKTAAEETPPEADLDTGGGDEQAEPSPGGSAPRLFDQEPTPSEAMVVPSGAWQGRTVGEIVGNPDGRRWLEWMLGPDQPRRDETHDEHALYLAAVAVFEAQS